MQNKRQESIFLNIGIRDEIKSPWKTQMSETPRRPSTMSGTPGQTSPDGYSRWPGLPGRHPRTDIHNVRGRPTRK